jgi:hypothetical protein
MSQGVQRCNNCGANLSLDDLRATNCKYCNTVFPHHAMAAQHAAMAGQVMNQMMAQQAQVQNQWRAGFGVGPMPTGVPGGPPPVGGPPGGYPPGVSPYGGPPGVSPYGLPPGAPGSPYADPSRIAAVHMAQSAKLSRNITIIVVAAVVVPIVLMMAIGLIVFLVR